MKMDQVRVGGTYTAKVSGGVVPVVITQEVWRGDKLAGWDATNTTTNRPVRIKSAQRLRAEVKEPKPGKKKAEPTPEVANAEAAATADDATTAATIATVPTTAPEATTTPPATPDATVGNVGETVANPKPDESHLVPLTKAMKPTKATKGKKASAAAKEPKPAKEPKAAKEAKPAKESKVAKAPKEAMPAKPKRLSCLDAAAQVLAKATVPMRATEMIAEMEKKELWTSPSGKTPEASLYAAIIREIAAKGKDSRFKKHDKGVFVAGKEA